MTTDWTQPYTKDGGQLKLQTHLSSCFDRPDAAVSSCVSLHILPSVCPSIIHPSLHPLSNHPFIHVVNQPSSRPTHTPLIQWLTLHWGGSILSWMASLWALRHNGQALFVQFISKVARPCGALTRVNSLFSSTYVITAKQKRGGIKQRASCTHAPKGAVVHAKLLVMTHDY